MKNVIIYPDNTALVDGRFTEDTKAIFRELRIRPDRMVIGKTGSDRCIHKMIGTVRVTIFFNKIARRRIKMKRKGGKK